MKPPRRKRILGAASLSAATATLAIAIPAWAAPEPTETQKEAPPTEPGPSEPTAPDGAAPDPGSADDQSDGAGRAPAAEPSGEGSASAGQRGGGSNLGDRTLRFGTRGRDVRRLQKILRHLNFTVKVTGRYGRPTQQQVRRFDIWKEPVVNGVVHRKQARRMRSLERRGARYRPHMFPIRGPHNYGGSGSRFGAPRSGHTHQGQDVAAASGTKLVAVHEGTVSVRQFQAGGAGHYLVIRGKDRTDSVYMHMLNEPRVRPGQRVLAGTYIGRVGSTGSSTGPHLHFELWTPHWFSGGRPFDPLPKLLRWDRRT